jgi:hypothetical protein
LSWHVMVLQMIFKSWVGDWSLSLTRGSVTFDFLWTRTVPSGIYGHTRGKKKRKSEV